MTAAEDDPPPQPLTAAELAQIRALLRLIERAGSVPANDAGPRRVNKLRQYARPATAKDFELAERMIRRKGWNENK